MSNELIRLQRLVAELEAEGFWGLAGAVRSILHDMAKAEVGL